jgi:hypothetical protein
MTRSPLRWPVVAVTLAGLLLVFSASERPQARQTQPAPPSPSRETLEAQADAERLVTALQLKKQGWGEFTKRGLQNDSIESLIASARILKYIWPPPGLLEVEDVQVAREKDAPEATDTKLPEAQRLLLADEVNEVLKRARELVKETVHDEKKAAAYELLIHEVEKIAWRNPVPGRFRALRRTIAPGQSHTYQWKWPRQVAGVAAFHCSAAMKLVVSQEESNQVYFNGETGGAAPRFLPGGMGLPVDKPARITIRIINLGTVAGSYILGVA